MGKKKVKKRRNGRSPYRWLLLIPIQLLLNKVILIIGLYVDSKIMEPKPGAQGHGAPFITFFAIAAAFWLTIIITIIAIRRMIVDIKKRKYEEDPVAELDEKLCLVMATENDIQDLHRIQVESFMPLYEKIGFVRVGDKEVVNENMSLVNYEYRRKE